MTLCLITGLRLGTDTTDAGWPNRLTMLLHREGVDVLVFADAFARSGNYRAAMARRDFIGVLGPEGMLCNFAYRYRTQWLFGPNDRFVLDPLYSDLHTLLTTRGITLRPKDFALDLNGGKYWTFSPLLGDGSLYKEPPDTRFRWLHNTIRLFHPHHRIGRLGEAHHLLARSRAQLVAERHHRKSGGRIIGLAHAGPGLPYYGRFGNAWCGSPGASGSALVINTTCPETGKAIPI